MPDRQPYPYIAPEFEARFGAGEMAWKATKWIYGDPQSNPNWKDDAMWEGSGTARLQRRVLAFSNVAATTGTGSDSITLGGGKNAVVVGWRAQVRPNTVVSTHYTLPDSRFLYVTVKVTRDDNVIICDTLPLILGCNYVNGLVGTGLTAAPEFILGGTKYTVDVANTNGAAQDIHLVWDVISLDTGR